MSILIRWTIILFGGVLFIGLCVPCSRAYVFFLSPADTHNLASVEILEVMTPYGPSENQVLSFTNGTAEAAAAISFQQTGLGSWATQAHGAGYGVDNGYLTDLDGTEWSRAELEMHAFSEGQLKSMGFINADGYTHTDYELQIGGGSDPVEVLLSVGSLKNTFPEGNQYITILDGDGQIVFSWDDEQGLVSIDQMSVFLDPDVSYLIAANSAHTFTEMSQDYYLYESSLTFTLETAEFPMPVPIPGSALMLGSGLVTLLAGVGRKRTTLNR